MQLKHVARRLTRFPMFTTIVVFTLGIGIGANSAIFSVVNGVLLKPLPYSRSDELVAVDHKAPGVNIESAGASPFLYFTYREQSKSFQDIGLWQGDTNSITGLAEPEEVSTIVVTDGVLPILGVKPLLGRLFTRADDAPGSPETMILTYGYWRSRFGGDPAAVGRRILVDGRPHEVIGMLPQSFRFLDRNASVVVPLRLDRSKTFLGNFSYRALARLSPGVTLDGAAADMARLIPVATQAFPAFPGFSAKMFEDARLDKRRVALVSENLARELWHDPAAALGKRVRETLKSPWREVVGVVSDERIDGFDRKAPTFVCWPLLMDDFEGDQVSVRRTVAFMIRSGRAGSSGLVNEVSRAVWSVNPDLPLADVRTLREIADKSLARTTFTLVMLSLAGAMALLLGVAGIYGVISYAVSQRAREIGIRMALGARSGEVTRMFVGQGLRLASIGTVIGLGAAFALTRLMASLLFDVSPADPPTYVGVSITLVSAAILASYGPALRAATADPAEALRAE